jgi:carboxyl-terminal processing protease
LCDRLEEVLQHIHDLYISDTNDDELADAAIQGMLTSLDPHSFYLSPRRFRQLKHEALGEFGGIGVELALKDGNVHVITAIDNTPASLANLSTNDIITHIDNQAITPQNMQEMIDQLRGPVDSTVQLRIRREGEYFDISLKRAIIQVPPIKWRTEQQIGYIRITTFNERTEGALKDAVTGIKEQLGDELCGVVLDLRNNAGGLLDQAVKVADSFLDKGEIVSTRGRDGTVLHRYKARPGDILARIPIIVLINAGSASAAEIVAGALQDNHRAYIMGQPSFGKGSVQKIIPLSNSGAIQLTIHRYFTPHGHEIQGYGITPNIIVPPQLLVVSSTTSIANTREKDIPGALNSQTLQDIKNGQHFADPSPALMQDYLLRRAVDLLMAKSFLTSKEPL